MSDEAKPAEKKEPTFAESLVATIEALNETAQTQTQLILALNERIAELEVKAHDHWWTR